MDDEATKLWIAGGTALVRNEGGDYRFVKQVRRDKEASAGYFVLLSVDEKSPATLKRSTKESVMLDESEGGEFDLIVFGFFGHAFRQRLGTSMRVQSAPSPTARRCNSSKSVCGGTTRSLRLRR